MKNCRIVEKQLTAYLHGELSEPDFQTLKTHLSTCLTCRAELEELRATLALLEAALASAPAPERIAVPVAAPVISPVAENTPVSGPELSPEVEKVPVTAEAPKWVKRRGCRTPKIPMLGNQLKALTISGVFFTFLIFLSGSFVVFNVVKRSEFCFSPPETFDRPKMKLMKARVRLDRTSDEKTLAETRSEPSKDLAREAADTMPDIAFPIKASVGDTKWSGSSVAHPKLERRQLQMPVKAQHLQKKSYRAGKSSSLSENMIVEEFWQERGGEVASAEVPEMKLKKVRAKVASYDAPKPSTERIVSKSSASMPDVELPAMVEVDEGLGGFQIMADVSDHDGFLDSEMPQEVVLFGVAPEAEQAPAPIGEMDQMLANSRAALKSNPHTFALPDLSGFGDLGGSFDRSASVGRRSLSSMGAAGSLGFGTSDINFFGAKSKGERLIFILGPDHQLISEGQDTPIPYEQAKDQMGGLIDGLKSATLFNVLVYDRDQTHQFRPGLVPATPDNREAMGKWIETIHQEHAVKLVPADQAVENLARPVQMAVNQKADQVFVLGGGVGVHHISTDKLTNRLSSKTKADWVAALEWALSTDESIEQELEPEPEPKLKPKPKPTLKPAAFNPYVMAEENAFSTFSIDVDTASYGLARQQLQEHRLPEPERVRTEEFVNSFDYDYRPPAGKQTFAVHSQMAPSPFRTSMEVLKIGVKGRRIGRDDHRGAVLTLVIDTSGSMSTPERLGLIKQSLALLIDQLSPDDEVAIVQFGNEARLVCEHTPASEKAVLLNAIQALQPGGPTQFDLGLQLGYAQAVNGFRAGDSNRILILSDGVANVGELDPDALLEQVADQRKKGIYLSVLGFGAGTYDDDLLEKLANRGDGMYAYINTLEEAHHLLVDQLAATLHVIASDVKIQVEFNPKRVLRYRQLGYENRQLTKEQFRDDTVDAGEVGSGQSVTALYDVELKPGGPAHEPIATVYVRYRRADNGNIEEINSRVTESARAASFESADERFQLATCVAEFAEHLRRSPYAEATEISELYQRVQPVVDALDLDEQVQELRRLILKVDELER